MRRCGRHPLARVWMPALVVLAAVACSSGAEEADQDAPTPGGVPASAPADGATEAGSGSAPSPQATTATPEEYQQALTGLDERLADGFAEVNKLRSPVGLPEAVAALRDQVDEERATLAQVVPPETVADAHAELDVALSDLSTDLTALESEAASNVVCAGNAAVRRAGNSDGAAAVREAAGRLIESDPVEEYTVGTFVPEDGDERNRRGRNGDLRPGRRNGPGVLKVKGSPEHDALLKLRIKKRGIRNVYVRAGSNVEVTDLPDGNYDVFIAQGVDFNRKSGRFTRECSFSRLDDPLRFRSTAAQYSVWELELTETVFGNAPSSPMDPKDFPS
jgi:hypothetical protein